MAILYKSMAHQNMKFKSFWKCTIWSTLEKRKTKDEYYADAKKGKIAYIFRKSRNYDTAWRLKFHTFSEET